MKKIKDNPKSWKVYKQGNEFVDYVSSWREVKGEEMENFIFKATIKPNGFYRGRSAAGFAFVDVNDGTKFTMRISKVEELMECLVSGKVKLADDGFSGTFTFVKQGANYSIAVA